MDSDLRIKRLRAALGWPQSGMARYLGVTQPTVFNMEDGQSESGPVGRLLDMLAHAMASGVVRPGMPPDECLEAMSGVANPSCDGEPENATEVAS